MSAPRPRRKRRLLRLLAGMLLVTAGVIFVGGYVALDRVPGGRKSVSFARFFSAGEIRYTFPTERLQEEVAAVFPLTQGLEGLLQMVLSNPQFVPDPDPSYLRFNVALEAQFVRGAVNERYPGRAVVRSQVRFDPAAATVRLHRAELVEFTFAGTAALVARGLRPLLEAGLQNRQVFALPQDGSFWTRTGVSLVRDVTIENHAIVVSAGL